MFGHFFGNIKARLFGGTYYDYYYYGSKRGSLYEKCTYKNGRKDGIFERYSPEGRLEMRGTYQNGLESGPFEEYPWNGKVEKCIYVNGHKNGPSEIYRKDGTLEEKRFYKDGKLNGVVEEYNERGKVIGYSFYENGELLKEQRLYPRKSKEQLEVAKKLDHINKTVPPSALRKRLKESMVKEFRLNHPKMKRSSEK